MVKLADVLPPSKAVQIPGGGVLDVRGITLEHMSTLLNKYKSELAEMVSVPKGSEPNFKALVTKSPMLVAEVICMASGTIGQEEDAKRIPVGAQVELLAAIWVETVPDLGKLLDLLSTVTAQVGASVPKNLLT